ncbi:MAG: hypothetical protein Q9168_004308 [Polycauliona sp. 1 TL-2023]
MSFCQEGSEPSPEPSGMTQLPSIPHKVGTLPRKPACNLRLLNLLRYVVFEAMMPTRFALRGQIKGTLPMDDNPNIFKRFYGVCKAILCASWVNALLVFVPVGIACEIAHVSPTIIFAMNAIAIIPLAGLLSYATESVASDMGDTIGALMNVTFGNAVELIIL